MGTPEHIYLDTFLVAGITTRTNNANEANPNSAQIPLLWMTFNTDEIANDIINQVANTPIYGVYHRYASDVNDDYSVTAGVAVIAPAVTAEDENIETIPVMVDKQSGTPVLLRDIASVRIGPQMRRGIAELDGEGEVVGGIS